MTDQVIRMQGCGEFNIWVDGDHVAHGMTYATRCNLPVSPAMQEVIECLLWNIRKPIDITMMDTSL